MRKLIALAAFAAVAASCDSTTGTDNSIGDITGNSRILLTDAPFPYDNVARVDVYVVSVATSLGADTSATSAETYSTFATPNRTINLLDLQGGLADELSRHEMPPGAVKSVRLIIDTDKSSITMKNGTKASIAWQSSAGQPVLNATIDDPILVSADGTDIIIDFDVGRSFLNAADVTGAGTASGFVFSPVLRATSVSRTGSVIGLVRGGSVAGAPVVGASMELKLGNPSNAENTWATVATTRTDSLGAFKFGYVSRSSLYTQPGWTYMVVATPPTGSAFTRQVVSNVIVTAGQSTSVGTVILP